MTFSQQLLEYRPRAGRRQGACAGPKLKILHLLSQQPAKTGSGVCLLAMVEHGAAAGFRQRAVIGVPADEPLPQVGPLPPKDIIPVRFGLPPVPFAIPGMSDIMPYPSTRFSEVTPIMLEGYLAAFAGAFQKATEDFCPDIVHSNHLWLMTALARTLFPDTPICVQSHGTELRQLVNAEHLSPFVLPACRDVDMVFALHPDNRDRVANAYGIAESRIRVVGAGFREDVFCPDGECAFEQMENELRIVYAGKIAAPKGVPWLLQAMDKIKPPDGMRVRLYLAGAGGDAQAEAIRSSAAGMDNVVFLGALAQEELARVFRSAHVFVLPSMYEGLPLVVIESLACGCLAVVSDLPGMDTWMPRDLCEQGWVERVPMPRLTGMDTPHPADLDRFVQNLADALSTQLARAASLRKGPDPFRHLDPLTWKGVFARVRNAYKELCPVRL